MWRDDARTPRTVEAVISLCRSFFLALVEPREEDGRCGDEEEGWRMSSMDREKIEREGRGERSGMTSEAC
jgi:hypothetical protein